jgi:hypothetical protein
MAMVVKVFAGEHAVHIGIATRTEQVMQTPAVLIDAVTGQAVIGDRHQRPQKWQVRPQPVMSADMRALQLTRTRRPQTLAGVIGVPHVEVPTCGPTGVVTRKTCPAGTFHALPVRIGTSNASIKRR